MDELFVILHSVTLQLHPPHIWPPDLQNGEGHEYNVLGGGNVSFLFLFTPSAFFSSNYFLHPFMYSCCILVLSMVSSLVCSFLLWRKVPLCIWESLCFPPTWSLAVFLLLLEALCHMLGISTCAGEVFSYVLISIWQKRKLWEFHQHLQTKLLSFTSRITQILNAGSKKI